MDNFDKLKERKDELEKKQTEAALAEVKEIVWTEQMFAFAHLPSHLKAVSEPFGGLALQIIQTLPFNRERTKSLDRLLESKDAAVRALVLK